MSPEGSFFMIPELKGGEVGTGGVLEGISGGMEKEVGLWLAGWGHHGILH